MAIEELIATLDGLSLFMGAVVGLLGGLMLLLFSRLGMRRAFDRAMTEQKSAFEKALSETKSAYESAASEMKASFASLSNEALLKNQREFLELASRRFEDQEKQHSNTLEGKKELIDQRLQSMSNSMTETLNTVPENLEKNQRNVSETIEKSARSLEESNKAHLSQLQERSNSQTKEHVAKLDEKELLISRRLNDMDEKLGEVQKLINEFEKSRESKLGALDDQLKNLTQTTSALQRALADNQARGQWGERIAEQILEFLGLREGISYLQQTATPSGARPDFTFLLPNSLLIHMDCKFPIDNYLKYIEADNEGERSEFSKSFLRNVEAHVNDVTDRGYIHDGTVDCVLLFIPNEQIYRFIHEEGSAVIDSALQNKVILCSPLTLYIVLAVIRQASENFAVEQRSQEILSLLSAIRQEWTKYTDMMDGMGKNFRTLQNKFDALAGTRTRQLDRQFARIDGIASYNNNIETLAGLPALPE